ncbi:hypothetical protein [Kingella potus]|uniref:hypothetical protein n=1 Tax=Kingella potus TaxID=265175 RepID=UPI0011C0821F|nr:hypothetical protein [Kingella potus]
MPAASPSKQTARTAGGRGRLKMPERNFGRAQTALSDGLFTFFQTAAQTAASACAAVRHNCFHGRGRLKSANVFQTACCFPAPFRAGFVAKAVHALSALRQGVLPQRRRTRFQPPRRGRLKKRKLRFQTACYRPSAAY